MLSFIFIVLVFVAKKYANSELFRANYTHVKSMLQTEQSVSPAVRKLPLLMVVEPVANVSHRFYEAVSRVLYFAPESPYMHIDRPVAAIVVVAPDLV